jgi:hypothetical protein
MSKQSEQETDQQEFRKLSEEELEAATGGIHLNWTSAVKDAAFNAAITGLVGVAIGDPVLGVVVGGAVGFVGGLFEKPHLL